MAYGVTLERTPRLRLPPHRDQPLPEDWRDWALAQTRPRAIDLFAGAGGLSLGIEQAGYRLVLAVDSEPTALETHSHNFAGPALELDMASRMDVDQLVELLDGIPIDLVAGGPPCQPFSRAGRSKIRSLVEDGTRHAFDHRRNLWRSYLHVVDRVRPRAILMENVPDMALVDDLRTIRSMISSLEELGYDVEIRLLDAWRYGVPQHRQRLILVAFREPLHFSWPVERPSVNVSQAIGDLPSLEATTGQREMSYRRPYTRFQQTARRGMAPHRNVIWDHITRPVRSDDHAAFKLMTPQTRYDDLPENLRRYRADIFKDKYNRLDWDRVSRSITAHIAKDGYSYIHPEEARTLSVREAARIQTFPDRFRFAGSRSHAFVQIGNAVPPALARSVASAILGATRRNRSQTAFQGTTWLRQVRTLLRTWGEMDRQSNPWRQTGSPWKAAVGALLGARSPAIALTFLEWFPQPSSITRELVRAFTVPLKPRAAAAVARLHAASHGWSAVKRPSELVERLNPSKSERAHLNVLISRDDGILPTPAALRVAARLTATNVDRKRRLSDGRMTIGKIIGSGPGVADLSAALHAVGVDLCLAEKPLCSACPLSGVCRSTRVSVNAQNVA